MKNITIEKLNQKYPEHQWAFVQTKDEVFYAALMAEEINYAQSPVTVLLQKIFDLKKDLSFFILRRPIYTNYKPTPKDVGMVKVVAKRIVNLKERALSFENETGLECEGRVWHFLEPGPSPNLSPVHEQPVQDLKSSPLEVLQNLVTLIPRGPILHDFDRQVAAVLVSEEGQILEFGLNSSHINKTLHAEINLLQRYFEKHQGPLPAGSRQYVTHKPCKMCAGMIYEALGENRGKVEIVYLNEVEGRHSSFTVLDQFSLNSKLINCSL